MLKRFIVFLLLISSSVAFGKRLAVAPTGLKSLGVDKTVASQLVNEIRSGSLSAIKNHKIDGSRIKVMTQENMLDMLEAQGKDLSCIDGECQVEVGRNIGASYIFTGEVIKLKDTFILSLEFYNTDTGELLAQDSVKKNTEMELLEAAKLLGESMIREGLGINRLPVVTQVAEIISPKGVEVGEKISCKAVFKDPEDGVLDVTYEWQDDRGDAIQVGSSLRLTEEESGMTLKCIATAQDSEGEKIKSSAQTEVSEYTDDSPTLGAKQSADQRASAAESLAKASQMQRRGDFKGAGEIFENLCNSGNALACVRMGDMLMSQGNTSSQEKNRAMYYFSLGCKNGQEMGCVKYQNLNQQKFAKRRAKARAKPNYRKKKRRSSDSFNRKKRARKKSPYKKQSTYNYERKSSKSSSSSSASSKSIGVGACLGLGADCIGVGGTLEYRGDSFGLSVISNGSANGVVARKFFGKSFHVHCGVQLFDNSSSLQGCGAGIDVLRDSGVFRLTGTYNVGEIGFSNLNGSIAVEFGASLSYTYLLF